MESWLVFRLWVFWATSAAFGARGREGEGEREERERRRKREILHFSKVVHQLIERKQGEIRQVHPGMTCFGRGVRRIDIKDIPGICKQIRGCICHFT